jgi:hypothetical protein
LTALEFASSYPVDNSCSDRLSNPRRSMYRTCLAVLLFSGLCQAQPPLTSPPAVSPQELRYLRFMLLNVASLDHDPKAIAAYEDSLVKLHGLSTQESAAIHSAGQTLHTTLAQNRQAANAIIAGRSTLLPSDHAALAALDTQREQTVSTLASQILN